MKSEIEYINELLIKLLNLLKVQKDKELKYIINQIEINLEKINTFLNGSMKDKNDLFMDLGNFYRLINKPRVGLSDYFIWHEDYDQRIKMNGTLDAIKIELLKNLEKLI